MVCFEDWKGQRKQKCKRGFATKREAQEWERTFQQQNGFFRRCDHGFPVRSNRLQS